MPALGAYAFVHCPTVPFQLLQFSTLPRSTCRITTKYGSQSQFQIQAKIGLRNRR
jgi:hypothetical protein